MKGKYVARFKMTNIQLPNKEEYELFKEYFLTRYHVCIGKIDGKRTYKLFRKYEDPNRFIYPLDLNVYTDDERLTMDLYGIGKRIYIFSLEGVLRYFYDKNVIVSYDAWDNCIRDNDDLGLSDEDEKDVSLFEDGRRKRIAQYLNGEFPAPDPEAQEAMVKRLQKK